MIAGLVCPYLVLAVIRIIICTVYQFEIDADNIIIIITSHILRYSYIFFIQELADHLIQLQRISESQRIEHKITDRPALGQDQYAFVGIFRPPPRLYVILSLI